MKLFGMELNPQALVWGAIKLGAAIALTLYANNALNADVDSDALSGRSGVGTLSAVGAAGLYMNVLLLLTEDLRERVEDLLPLVDFVLVSVVASALHALDASESLQDAASDGLLLVGLAYSALLADVLVNRCKLFEQLGRLPGLSGVMEMLHKNVAYVETKYTAVSQSSRV